MKKSFWLVLFLPFLLMSQATESAHHLAIQKGELVPERDSTTLLHLDFTNTDAKWEKVINFEEKLRVGYGEQMGKRGFFLAGPASIDKTAKYPRDTAWQIYSAQFPVKGFAEIKGNIVFYSDGKFQGLLLPHRDNYVNTLLWYAADGSLLGSTPFSVTIWQKGYCPVSFVFPVPENAVKACFSLGADTPDIATDAALLITEAMVKGCVGNEPYHTDAVAVMPPVRYSSDVPLCALEANTPAGSSIVAEVAFAADDHGMPQRFSPFGPLDAPIPANTEWVKCQLRFKTDGTVCPVLHSATICNRRFDNWQTLWQTTPPVVRRISPSPSANPSQPLEIGIFHDVPVNWSAMRVILNGTDITKELKRSNGPNDGDAKKVTTCTYTPQMPFEMRKVHKAEVYIADIYGNNSTTPIYFFFDQPLEKGVITLRQDGQMLMDGQPFFPISAPAVLPLPANDHNLDNAFAWLKEAGFNIVSVGKKPEYREYLDKAAKYGLKMGITPGNIKGPTGKELDEILERIAREYRHPALLAWNVGDDTIDYNTPEAMMQRYEAIRAVDPYHITVQADYLHAIHPFAPVAKDGDTSRYRSVVNFTDSFRCELYPVHDFTEKNAMECVPIVIDDIKTICRDIHDKATAPRHIWAAVQYFEGWGQTFEKAHWKRFPTWQELRAMTWGSIIYGARGMQWYSYRYETKRFIHGFMYKEETRNNIKRIASEIASLIDVLGEPNPLSAPTVEILSGPDRDALQNDSIGVMVRKHGDITYLFALNSAYKPVKARIAVKGVSEATLLYEDARAVPLENGALVDEFQAYDVHIYKLK